MSGSTPKKVTVVYVATTGHIVAAVTRTDTSGPSPSVADLVGDSLALQMGWTQTPATPLTIPDGTFLIPATDLALVEIDFGLLGSTPWGQAMNLVGASGGPVLGQPPSVLPLTTFVSPPTAVSPSKPLVNVSIPTSTALSGFSYYIILAQPLTVSGFPTTCKGNLPTTATPVSLTVPNMVTGTSYLVLVLVQTLKPYVAILQA